MKMVIAYVKPEMLNDVVFALHKIEGLRGASVCDGRGFGAWRLGESPESVQKESGIFLPHARVEIVCSDDVAEEAVKAIAASARTGRPGDGLVFTVDAETCVNIRTGEAEEWIR